MHPRHVFAALAAAALSALGQDACASTAQAAIANFSVELIDLDPSDGITPAITFQQIDGGSFVAAETGTPGHPLTDIELGGVVFGGAGASSSSVGATSAAALVGDPMGGGASVTTSAASSLPGTYAASTVWLGDGHDYVSFTLTAATRLVISGDASAAAASSFDDAAADAWASAFLELTDYTGQGDVSLAGVQAERAGVGSVAAGVQVDSGHLEVSFENLSGASVDGLFFGAVDASVSDPAPAVPEPATAALMLAALGAGLVAGRRARPGARP